MGKKRITLLLVLALAMMTICPSKMMAYWSYQVDKGASYGTLSNGSVSMTVSKAGDSYTISACTCADGVTATTLDLGEASSMLYQSVGKYITNIADGAFKNCTALTSVSIGDTYESIGAEAFSGCTGLATVNIAYTVSSIGANAFDGCTSLSKVWVRRDIYEYFSARQASSIASLNGAFGGTSSTTVYVPALSLSKYKAADNWKNVANLKGMLNYTTNLYEYNSPKVILGACGSPVYFVWNPSGNNLSISAVRIRNAQTTEEVTNNNNVGDNSFECKSIDLSLDVFDDNGNQYYITLIGDGAFMNSSVETIKLPSTLNTLGSYAFRETNITSLTIPESVTTINSAICLGCQSLESVTWPSTSTSIPSSTFSQCKKLKSFTIPSTVKEIGMDAFNDCGLTSIVIPEGVEEIGDMAFEFCSDLKEITVPSTLKQINDYYGEVAYAFTNVTLLRENLHNNSTFDLTEYGLVIYEVYENGLYYSDEEKTTVISINPMLSSVVIPSTVTTIADKAFQSSYWLATVYFNSLPLPTLGSNMINSITTKLYIPASAQLTTGWSDYSSKVKTVIYYDATANTLTDGLFTINNVECASGTSDLTIGTNYRNTTLTSVDLTPSIIDISANEYTLKKITATAFLDGALTSVKLPNSITYMGYWAFGRCNQLTTANIPTGMTSISDNTFENCYKLQSITIPGTIQTIEYEAFENCTSLNSITFEGIPYAAISSTFKNIPSTAEVSYTLSDDSYVYDGDGNNYLPSTNDKAISYTRTLADGQNWGTAVLPFEIKSNDDVRIYTLSSVTDGDDGAMTVASTEDIVAAGTPFVFKKLAAEATKVTFTAVSNCVDATTELTAETEVSDWTMKGTYVELTGQTNKYIIANDKFWLADGEGVNIKPFRGWFETTASAAKEMTINVVENDATTRILTLDADGNLMENAVYNLSGQKLNAPQKGVNIINGKKVYNK